MADLRLKFSPCGDGKRITCGYAYMGLEPALAWADACRDLLYPVMRQSIESFDQQWPSIRASLDAPAYHYVSLGPGDGRKDGVILSNLWQDDGEFCYVPVDASTEMLRLAVRDLIVRLKLPSSNILALPWDFSTRHVATALRYLLDGAFGDAPVLFSLLGNTLANFDDDAGLLTQLTAELLRPQDRLLLEVATTPDLSDQRASQAAEEYATSEGFGEFVTSALRRHTDLSVDKVNLQYDAIVEGDRALLVKMNYRNHTNADVMITLANRDRVVFKPGDTIRLALVRKYTNQGLDDMLATSGLTSTGDWHSEFTGTGTGFGMALKVLAGKPPDTKPETTLADHLWRR